MLSRITLIGRLTKDPELRTTNTGKNICEFTLAVDKRIKPQDPNQPTADFFQCKAWNQGADFMANFGSKGRLCSVDGRIESRQYVDKDGNNRKVWEVVADNVSLLDRAKDDKPSEEGGYSSIPRSQGGGGTYRPNPSTPQTGGADEYDPFADEN